MEPQQVERATWARCLSQVRGFARWVKVIDDRTEVPPARLLSARRRRNPPHIYTLDEINRLMRQAAQLRSPTGLRALTYTTLIGLLVATGLQPSEAMGLDRNDVDLIGGILSIRNSKFGKSRFVPLHASIRMALCAYSLKRDLVCRRPLTDAFLVSEDGRRPVACSARSMFARLSRATGLRATHSDGRDGYGPRLQAFRHSFATERMVQWYREGRDVRHELPKLSTYLCRVGVGLTYWYIEAVPELLNLAAGYLGNTAAEEDQV